MRPRDSLSLPPSRPARTAGLRRAVRTDVEAGGTADPVECQPIDTRFEQPFATPLLIPPGAERADVEGIGRKRPGEHRDVELVVVRENDYGGRVIRLHLGERLLRPGDDHLVCMR